MSRRYWLFVAVFVAGGVTPVLAQDAPAKPPVMKHTAEGRQNCLMCHKVGIMPAVPDVPESHATRTIEMCTWCHAADAAMQTKTPPVMSHAAAGREKCLMCHNVGVMDAVPDVPADHKGRAETVCGLCHQPAATK